MAEPLLAVNNNDVVAPPDAAKNSVGQIALLIIANCAGAGILSLPKAMNGAGLWPASCLVVFAAVLSAYTADILGRCYSMTEGDDTGGSFFARSPYAAIGYRAAGAAGAIAVTTAQVLTQFSVLVLFFLVSGVNLNKLVPQHRRR